MVIGLERQFLTNVEIVFWEIQANLSVQKTAMMNGRIHYKVT